MNELYHLMLSSIPIRINVVYVDDIVSLCHIALINKIQFMWSLIIKDYLIISIYFYD